MGSAGTAWRARAPRWSPVQRSGVARLHPHPVNPPAHDRGTAVHGRAPVPDPVYELPFGRMILTRAWLGFGCESSRPFWCRTNRGAASNVASTRNRHLAPASAKVGARRLVHEICNRRIVTCARVVAGCARFGRAGLVRRIRRAPARSLLSLRREKARLVTIKTTTTAGSRDRDGRIELRCHTPPSPPTNIPWREPIHSTPGVFPSPSTNETPDADAGSPLTRSFSL